MDYRVVKDPFIFLSHSLTNNQWTIAFHGLYPAETFIYRFSMEGQIIRAVRFCQDLTGHNHSITAIHLNYPAPDYAEEYQILLPCPVYFDQEENSITFDPTILGDKLPAANKAMNTLCTHDCNIKLSQLESKKSFRNKVYEELFRTFSQEKNAQLSLINVANRLYISPRTLRRKLLTENTSFKIISNDARRDLAIYYLSNTALSTKEISFMLGYSSVNNFHRAFKQWTGKPISEFNQHTD